MRSPRLLVGLLAGVCLAGAWCGVAVASAPPSTVPPGQGQPTAPTVPVDPSNGLPAALGPLVVQPSGCVSPSPPLAVFEGRINDAVSTTARFEVRRLLAGSLDGYIVGDKVDVRYGDETRFLEVGGRYIVGVGRAAGDGFLVSTVREPLPLFGGDAVVGVNDSDVDCFAIAEPVRTLLPDGSPVDTGVFAPLRGNGASVLGAVLRPLGIALVVLLGLVLLKHLVFAIGRTVRDSLDEPAPAATRRHGGS